MPLGRLLLSPPKLARFLPSFRHGQVVTDFVLERDTQMNHQPHFGSSEYAALKQAAKIRALICDLDRVVRILESDIASEEEFARVADPCSGAYPMLARVMMARRDNLKETITALELRLPPQEAAAG